MIIKELSIDLDNCHVILLNTFNKNEAQSLFAKLADEGIKNIFVESVIVPEKQKTSYFVRSVSFDDVESAVKFRTNTVFRKPEIEELMMKVSPLVKCEKAK